MAHERNTPSLFSFYLLFNLAGILASVLADISWDTNSLQVNQGEDVTVTCTMLNAEIFEVLRVSKEGHEGTHTIADRTDIKKQFLETKRYNVTYKYDAHKQTATLALHYKGIRGEDAGILKCEKLGESGEARLDLNVIVPIDRLSFIQKQGAEEREIGEEDREISLVEGEEGSGIKCHASVSGSLTPPMVKVLIEDVDRSELFAVESSSDVQDPNGGLGLHSANTNLTYLTANPNPEFNYKTMTCKAEMDNGSEEEVITKTLNIKYSPRVTCNKYKHFGIVGESIAITCEVKSNPPSQIVWQRETREDGILTIGDEDYETGLEAEKEDLADDQMRVTLHIDDIQSLHFTNYILTATNDIGSKTIKVALTQGSPPKKPTPPQDQASNEQPANPGIENSTPQISTARAVVEVPQEVQGNGSERHSSLYSLLGLVVLVIGLLSQR